MYTVSHILELDPISYVDVTEGKTFSARAPTATDQVNFLSSTVLSVTILTPEPATNSSSLVESIEIVGWPLTDTVVR